MMNVLAVAITAQLIAGPCASGLVAYGRHAGPVNASCSGPDMVAVQNTNSDVDCREVMDGGEGCLSSEFNGLGLLDSRKLVFDYCGQCDGQTTNQGSVRQHNIGIQNDLSSHVDSVRQIPKVAVGLYTNASSKLVFRYLEYCRDGKLVARGSMDIKSLPARSCVSDWRMEAGTNRVQFSFAPQVVQSLSPKAMILRVCCDMAETSSTCAFLVPGRYMAICMKDIVAE